MRAVGYLRVSTDRQSEDGQSLEVQRERIEAYARVKDLEIVEWCEDAGESAKDLKRPGVQSALTLLKRGKAEALIVADLDRLTRRLGDLTMLVENYFEKRYRLLSVSQEVDTASATGRLFLYLIGMLSAWERERLGERMRIWHEAKQGRGEAHGRPPYGWRSDPDGMLEPIDHEQAALRDVWTWRVNEGHTYAEIQRRLEADEHKPRGKTWHATTVVRMCKRIEAVAKAGAGKEDDELR